MKATEKRRPSMEDIAELSEIEVLHPGGFDLSKRIGEVVDMRNKKVLEVACGRGVFACYYAKNFGARITGMDINPDMIKSSIRRAKEEAVEGLVEFKVADALDSPFPFRDGSFDVVVNECALGLASDPRRCLNEMARVTKPGGYIVIHLALWLKELPESDKKDVEKRLGGSLFTASELSDMLKKTGAVEIWNEDWSGVEQMGKIRPGRKIERVEDIFTLREKIAIIFRTLKGYGLKGLFYLNESTKKITPLYYNGTFGYSLVIGQKPGTSK